MSRTQILATVAVLLVALILLLRVQDNRIAGDHEMEWRPEYVGRNLKTRKPQVIKGRGAAIYIVEGGYKHVIPDWDTYTDLEFDANEVRLVSDQELNSIPDGAPVKAISDRKRIDANKICPCESISRQPFAIKANLTIAPHKVCIIANEASDKLFTEYYDPTYLTQHLKVNFVSENLFKKHEEVARWSMYDKAFKDDAYQRKNESLYDGVNGISDLDALKYANSVTGIEYVESPTQRPTYKPGEAPPPPLSKLEAVEEEKHPHKNKTEDGSYDSDRDPYPSQYFFNKNEEGRQGDEPGLGADIERRRRRLVIQRSVAETEELSCDVTIEVMDDSVPLRSHVCPGICLPHPRAIVPIDLLRPEPNNPETDLLCSMRLDSIFPSLNVPKERQAKRRGLDDQAGHVQRETGQRESGPDKMHARLAILLQAIGRRKIEECLEREYWVAGRRSKYGLAEKTLQHHPSHARDPPKRVVRGLIIWIGSLTRFPLARRQIDILKSQDKPEDAGGKSKVQLSEEQIVGWLATEEVYPCRLGSTLCDTASPHQSYFMDMPSTRLDQASGGYSCAQRRPLRALAHTLRLFDPSQFVMIVDDDTWVNMNYLKLGSPFSNYMSTVLNKTPFVVGEMTRGKKITSHGFFYGGAGYVFGKAVLDRLTSHKVMGPVSWMAPRSKPEQTAHLQLLTQTIMLSNHSCPKDSVTGQDTCLVKLHGGWEDATRQSFGYGENVYAELNEDTTMVDVCMNIMAEEHSCYHSDHALTRCIVHGIYATPLDQWCGGRAPLSPPELPVPPSDKGGPAIGMCMQVDEKCLPDVHLTCHHWMPDPKDYTSPIPANNDLDRYE